jgi:hypothetical protein
MRPRAADEGKPQNSTGFKPCAPSRHSTAINRIFISYHIFWWIALLNYYLPCHLCSILLAARAFESAMVRNENMLDFLYRSLARAEVRLGSRTAVAAGAVKRSGSGGAAGPFALLCPQSVSPPWRHHHHQPSQP